MIRPGRRVSAAAISGGGFSGVRVGGGANAIRVANGICAKLAAGNTPTQAWHFAVANTQLGMAQAVTFTRISMNVYCPQYLSEIGPNGISGTIALG